MTTGQFTLLVAAIACCLTPASCEAQSVTLSRAHVAPVVRPETPGAAPRVRGGMPGRSLAVGAGGAAPQVRTTVYDPRLGAPPRSLAVGALGWPPQINLQRHPRRFGPRHFRPRRVVSYASSYSSSYAVPGTVAALTPPQTVVLQTAPPAPVVPQTIQLGGFCRVPQPPQTCSLDETRVVGSDCSCSDKADGPVPGKVFRP